MARGHFHSSFSMVDVSGREKMAQALQRFDGVEEPAKSRGIARVEDRSGLAALRSTHGLTKETPGKDEIIVDGPPDITVRFRPAEEDLRGRHSRDHRRRARRISRYIWNIRSNAKP
jgi:hypothetical protein